VYEVTVRNGELVKTFPSRHCHYVGTYIPIDGELWFVTAQSFERQR